MNAKIPRTPFSTHLSGSAREVELRLKHIFSGPKKRPPVLFLALMFSVCVFCGNLVSCHMAETEPSDLSEPAGSSLEDLPDLPEAEVREYSATLENIDLDGDGLEDVVTATVRFDPQGNGESNITLTAALGRGETVERQWTEEGWLSIESFSAGNITSPDRDALVLELSYPTSNYGAAQVHILELDGGELTQCYCADDDTAICGAYCIAREDSPLSAVRIPALVEKWHAPEYYTLSWNGTGWDLVEDGYFTDAETVTVTGGRVLTLALRGRVTGEQFGSNLIYDQIQVFDGDMMFNPNMLLQTITEDSVVQDDSYLFEGILCPTASGVQVDVRDVNFDGADDFGIYCGNTYNGPMYWFLWDEETWSFRPGFFSSIDLTVDEKNKQLVDAWKDGNIGYDCYTYQFNDQGERELVDHQHVDSYTAW